MRKKLGIFTSAILAVTLLIGMMFGTMGAEAADDFADVEKSEWYYDAVDFAVQRGLVTGVTDTLFAPSLSVTRAQLVTMLWRNDGSPEMKYTAAFTDIPNGKWYTSAVLWAAKNGIVNGTSENEFTPEDAITREQMAAVFYRYAEFRGVLGEAETADLSKYADCQKIHEYAYEAMSWSVGEGLIMGIKSGEETLLDPRGYATRAQGVTIIYRFITTLLESEPDPSPTDKEPLIIYHGNTIAQPGDVVTVTGEYLDSIKSVTVEGQNVRILQGGRESLKFELPDGLETGAYKCDLNGGGAKKSITVNKPVSVWIQGDEGGIATPGGWIRVNGKCLSVDGEGCTLELNGENGKKSILPATNVKDAYSAEIAIPEDTAYGTYAARYSNGYAVSEKFEITIGASPRDSWPTTVFNILDYGAVAAHGGYTAEVSFDNSDAFRAALAAAKENGGGVVYFPRGYYHMSSAEFTIPEKTVIRGEGMNLVRIFWGGEEGSGWTVDELPSHIFISHNGNCALEEITFQGALMPTLLKAGQKPKYQEYGENVYVKRCRVWSNMYAKHNGFWDSSDGYTEDDIKKYNDMRTMMFDMRCDNFQLTDCELEWDTYTLGCNDSFYLGYYKNLLFRNNELMRTGCHCLMDGAIFEDNSMIGSPKGDILFGLNGEKCYFARNYIKEGADSGDREAISSDWNACTLYHSQIAFTDDTHVVFPEEAGLNDLTPVYNSYFKPRIAVMIVNGTGVGQYRYITERDGSALTLESPFDAWDETSEFTATRLNSRWYIVENTFENTGDCQFYTGQTDSVFADNLMYYAGGFTTYGQEIYGGWQCDWYNSYVGNTIEAGMSYQRFGNDGHSKLQVTAYGDVRLNMAMTVRRNKFLDTSFAEVYTPNGSQAGSDMILEDNFFKDTHWGIKFSGGTCFPGTVISGNRYENVDIPLTVNISNSDQLLELD